MAACVAAIEGATPTSKCTTEFLLPGVNRRTAGPECHAHEPGKFAELGAGNEPLGVAHKHIANVVQPQQALGRRNIGRRVDGRYV